MTQGVGESSYRMKKGIRGGVTLVIPCFRNHTDNFEAQFDNRPNGGKLLGVYDVGAFDDFFEVRANHPAPLNSAQYFRGPFSDIMYGDTWYNGDALEEEETNWIKQYYKILGGVSLRQVCLPIPPLS